MGNTLSTNTQKNITMTPEQYKQYLQYLKHKKIQRQTQKQKQIQRQQNETQNKKSNIIKNRNNYQIGQQNNNNYNSKINSRQYDNVGNVNGYIPRMQPMLNNRNDSSDFMGKLKNLKNNRNFTNQEQKQKQNQYKSQSNNKINGQSNQQKDLNQLRLEDCDPFGLLKTKKMSLEKLKNSYRKLALIHHPDKGGNVNKFNLLMDAYSNLKRLIEYKNNNKSHRELKNRYKQDREEEKKTTNINLDNYSGNKFNRNKFNKIYEENRFENPYDVGYGNIMESSEGKIDRDDINVSNFIGKYNKKSFQSEFSNLKKKSNRKVVIYSKPKPIESNKLQYSNLVEDNIKDFSDQKNSHYTDYKKAHINNYLIDSDSVKIKKQNYKDLKTQRKNIVKFTKEEVRKMEKEKEIEELLNWEQTQKLKQNDRRIFNKYKKTHRLMLQ